LTTDGFKYSIDQDDTRDTCGERGRWV